MRLNCVAQNQNKGYYCTECAEMFSTTDEPKGHEEINHSVRGTKRAVHETVIVEEHGINNSESFTKALEHTIDLVRKWFKVQNLK